MSVTIKWHAIPEEIEDEGFGANGSGLNRTVLPGEYADCEGNAEGAVNDVMEDYFKINVWDDWFGLESGSERVIVKVFEPASIAGVYDVDLVRPVKSHASKRP
jgi:hypothetical protein